MQVGIISFHLSDGMLRISNLVNRSRKLVGFLTVHQLDSAELHFNLKNIKLAFFNSFPRTSQKYTAT